RLHADRLAPVHHHRSGAARNETQDRLQRRAAPGAVAAQERHHLACSDIEVDAVKNVRLTVKGMQVRESQQLVPMFEGACHCSAPMYASSTAEFRETSEELPSARTLPRARTDSVSA